MWINSRDEEEQTNQTQEQAAEKNNTEWTTENISESQEITEGKILKVASRFKSEVDIILDTITSASAKNTKDLSELEKSILDDKVWAAKEAKERSKVLENIIKEGWSEDYISSLEKTKKHIDRQSDEIKNKFDKEDKKDIEEYKPVWTWASSEHNFDDISKQDQRMNDDNKYEREFS